MYTPQTPVPLITCPSCHGTSPANALRCMWCGAPLTTIPQAKKLTNKWLTDIIIIVVVLGIAGGVYAALNTGGLLNSKSGSGAPPSYVKDVVALQEGFQAFSIYFVLADAQGSMTSSDGTVTLEIAETDSLTNSSRNLFKRNFGVKRSDFVQTEAGLGAFKHDVLLLNIGRVTYSEFDRVPTQFGGKVTIAFEPLNNSAAGRVLTGVTTVIFDK